MRINLTDNNLSVNTGTIYKREEVSALFPYGNKTIRQLCQENEGLLIFPECINDTEDRINDGIIFSIDNTKYPDEIRLTTGNVVGFLGFENLKIKIQSRFDEGRNDYFLHYMLEKVLSFNLFDLTYNNDDIEIFDFLMFMFPHFLESALQQGLYREYQRQEYDDSRVKGSINVSRFIRKDIPFCGRITYSERSYSYDNAMTELIRHTIEFIKTRKYGQHILGMDCTTIENVRNIIHVTPGYERNERNRIIQQNLRPKIHPYYTQYQTLQNLCLQILRFDEIKYGEREDEIYGLLFDAAWLWEEYLFKTVIEQCGFKHPQNKAKKGGIYLFEKITNEDIIARPRYKRYPDFFKSGFILDAKYKRLFQNTIDRDDMHQMISYMHVENAPIGGFIYPIQHDKIDVITTCLGTLRGQGGIIYKIGVPIPQHCESYRDFSQQMSIIEKSLQDEIHRIDS